MLNTGSCLIAKFINIELGWYLDGWLLRNNRCQSLDVCWWYNGLGREIEKPSLNSSRVCYMNLHANYPWAILNRKRDKITQMCHICPLQRTLYQRGRVMAHSSPWTWGKGLCPTKRPSQAVKVEAPYCIQSFYISFNSEQILFLIQKSRLYN